MVYEYKEKTIEIQEETTKNPIELCGIEAGCCWGADISNYEKNYKRGLDCIKSGHGRVLEFPQVYITIDGYSARFCRELYVHIAGGPTRLQASTRYIDYSKDGFSFIVPPSISKDKEARVKYIHEMRQINKTIRSLIDDYNISREDAANLLPLGMTSKMVMHTNARHLIDMSRQRMCSRALWEYRDFMEHLALALTEYSPEWKELIDLQFGAKCEFLGYCPEKKGCGRYPAKD